MKEIIITVGFPASGKSTLVKQYINQGYHNLNRDNFNGSIADLHKQIEPSLQRYDKIILDNTYMTVEHRKDVVQIAKKLQVPIKVLWLKTSIEECQFNACYRTLTGGRYIPAGALFKTKKEFSTPHVNEGFVSIEEIQFKRVMPSDYKNKALILDYDNTVRIHNGGGKYPTNISQIEIMPGIVDKLKKYRDDDYILCGASNQSSVGKGEITSEKMDEMFAYTNKLLGFDIDVLYCPDASFPIKSYDRKPLPGMGVKHILKYKLDPSKTIMVGDATVDKTFASRCGFTFIHITDFLK